MENNNIILIILIIVIIFFLSGDKNITTQTLNNNAFPLLLILVIFYICYNKFSMSLVFVCLLLLIISTTGLKDIIIQRLDYHTDNQFSSRLNELFSNIMNKQTEHLETMEEEADDNSVFDSAEGIDDLSYDDFKQEISEFNGNSSEQNRNIQQTSPPDLKPPDPMSQLDTDTSLNQNNGRDINSMFEELNNKVDELKTNPKYSPQ